MALSPAALSDPLEACRTSFRSQWNWIGSDRWARCGPPDQAMTTNHRGHIVPLSSTRLASRRPVTSGGPPTIRGPAPPTRQGTTVAQSSSTNPAQSSSPSRRGPPSHSTLGQPRRVSSARTAARSTTSAPWTRTLSPPSCPRCPSPRRLTTISGAIGRVVGLCACRAGTREYDVRPGVRQPEEPFVGRVGDVSRQAPGAGARAVHGRDHSGPQPGPPGGA